MHNEPETRPPSREMPRSRVPNIEMWLAGLGGVLLLFGLFPALGESAWRGARVVAFHLDARYWTADVWAAARIALLIVCATLSILYAMRRYGKSCPPGAKTPRWVFVASWVLLVLGFALWMYEVRRPRTRVVAGLSKSYDYLIHLPPGYGRRPEKWPLILFLHGAGERSGDVRELISKDLCAMIPRPETWPYVIVSPQCPKGASWEPDRLARLLDEVVSQYAVDEDRVVVTGYSMGGRGTWNLAVFQPDRFAGVAPVCGSADPSLAACFVGLPVWAFHGEKDEVIPVKCTREMVTAVRKAGGDARMTLFPNEAHGCWPRVYASAAFRSWVETRARRKRAEKSRSDRDSRGLQANRATTEGE